MLGHQPLELLAGILAALIGVMQQAEGLAPAPDRHDQRTVSSFIFGAICLKQGKGAGLVLPFCNTEAMSLHLIEIAAAVAPGAHAVLPLDQAGWHLSNDLLIPPNITIVPLQPGCPELNPVENVWQFMRDNWLSNRVFISYDDILDHCCDAWNKLTDQPWWIITIGMRNWANRLLISGVIATNRINYI